jgi:hypothetical protein
LNSTFAIFLDLLVIVLMIATIGYAVSLNRSISKLRDGKAELATLLGNLAEAVAHADVAIKGMKAIAGEYDNSLSQRIGTARALVDELNVINETADNLASRIERAVQGGRSALPQVRTPDPLVALAADQGVRDAKLPEVKPRKPAPSQDRAGSEKELIDAIELLRRTA